MEDLNMVEEAKIRASRFGEVVGLVSRVSPISHGIENNQIRAEISYDVYLKRKFVIGTYVGISLLVPRTLMLGRIVALERSDILSITKVPALSPSVDPTGITTPLSLTIELLSEKVGDEVVPPSSPVDPQSPLFFPNKEFVKEMLGLNVRGLSIGKLIEGYKEMDVDVPLTEEMLRHHVLVVGTTGAGKTNLLKLIISRSEVPALAFDLQGDYIRLIAELGGNVLVPVTVDYASGVTDFINQFLRRTNLQRFKIERIDGQKVKLSDGSDSFNMILVGFRLRDNYKELTSVSPFFTSQGAYFFRIVTENCMTAVDEWIQQCEDVMRDMSVHSTTMDNIKRSVRMLEDTGILDVTIREGTRRFTLGEPNYEELLTGKSVMDLRWALERGVSSATVAAFLTIAKVFNIIDQRYKNNGRETPFLLIFDEAHEYFPQARKEEDKEGLERLINKILRLGRVRGMGTILATHRPTDLNDLILTLTNTKVAMRADEDALEKIGMDDYANLLQASPPGYAVMRSFSLRVKELIFRTEKLQS
ncbi:ATP-binding protein [Metallosphaera sp.]|uniref:ATP-binding protein n=1 Tax=Metallosphaera sp. TaxID=2020860 RepID=UPI00315E0ABF